MFGLHSCSPFSARRRIDLGTANTLVWVRDRGIVISEPSVVALEPRPARSWPSARGQASRRTRPASSPYGRCVTDHHDFDVTQQMIAYFVARFTTGSAWCRAANAARIPSGVTEVEKRASETQP